MDPEALRELLWAVRSGAADIDAAMERLKDLPYTSLGFARLDHHRALRTGFPEVVFCPGKTPEQAAAAVEALAARHGRVMATRADRSHAAAVQAAVPEAVYHEVARVIMVGSCEPRWRGLIAVLAAGTADLPVAEEAGLTAEVAGCRVARVFDVGVAGLHRVLEQVPLLREAAVIIAVAGMDGALPGVVAGLTHRPVVAVPTSIGYGAGAGGVAALLTMLNACAPGLAVTNIDNGFGAGMMAARIAALTGEVASHAE